MLKVLLLVLLAHTAHAADRALPPITLLSGRAALEHSAPALGISCARDNDATAKLRSVYESEGTNPGGYLFLPPGCVVLLGSPGAGDAVLDLPSDTTIECADRSAGFMLARERCSGGDTPGGACEVDADCPGGGACGLDGDAASAFAPAEGSTYTVLRAAAGSSGQAIRRCTFWVNQVSANPAELGGDAARYGYCDGGTSDGATCFSQCNAASGLQGLLCNADTDCGSAPGRACDDLDHCASGGGTCRSWSFTQPGGASGPGKITALDFSQSSDFTVEDVRVVDLRTSDVALDLGSRGKASHVVANAFSPASNPITSLTVAVRPAVDVGIQARPGTLVTHATASGWTAAYKLVGGTGGETLGPTVTDSIAEAYGAASEATWPGTVGFLFTGAGGIAKFNRISTFICGMPADTNVNYPFFYGNQCDGAVGPLWQIQGAHNNVQFNRKAWGGKGALLSLGEIRGRCAGGSRSGLLCLQGAGTDSAIGCPSSSCAAHDDFKGGAGSHFQVLNNFLHSDQTALEGYVTVSSSKRCSGGSEPGTPCSVNGDCAGSGTCASLSFSVGQVNNNELYNVLGAGDGIDLDSAALATGGLAGISLVGNLITMNSGGTGIRLPATAAKASQLRVDNLVTGATNDVLNWADSMGTLIHGPGTLEPGSMDAVSGTDSVNLSNATEATVLTLADYDNAGRATKLEAFVQVNAATGSTRDFTVRLKLEGSTVATALLGGVPGGKSATIPLTWVDTVSASGRTATVTVEVATTGTTSSASNRALTRVTQ